MTRIDERSTTVARATDPMLPVVAGAAALAGVAALFLPDHTSGGAMSGMSVTHYMGLLAANQPWNLIIFMAIPVILAETLAITELVRLYTAYTGGTAPAYVRTLSRWAGLVVGPIMVGIGVYLLKNAIVPLTTGSGWRGAADLIAVLSYLVAAVPLIGITMVETGMLARGDQRRALKLHATFVGIFLVVAHVAMIFGMLDPSVLGWSSGAGMAEMPGMTH